MTKLIRKTHKVFAENAPSDEMGVFGSAKTNDKTLSKDVDEIQSLDAYAEGWGSAVISSDNYPAMEEMNGVMYCNSYQTGYLLQEGIPEWDANTEYSSTSIVKGTKSGKLALYSSKQDENINHLITDSEWWEELKFGGGGSSTPIGFIGTTLYIDESLGLQRYLNGSVMAFSDNNTEFIDYLRALQNTSPQLFCDEETWQSLKTLSHFGQVGKFVLDESNMTVRLPRVINVQGVFDMQNLGATVEAGLPNIEASTGAQGVQTQGIGGGALPAFTGAFSGVCTGGGNSSGGSTSYNLMFNASRSNPIYGNSDTVQEEAIQYPYYIQIATGQERKQDIINTLETNVPYTMFEVKWSDCILNNPSWLRGGVDTFYPKGIYQEQYEALQVEANAEVEDGATVTLPIGKLYTKRGVTGGLSCKLSTDEYDDYDFVLNTTNESFRLPIKSRTYAELELGRILIDKKEPTDTDPSWYNIYSDGWCEQGNVIQGQGRIGIQLSKPYIDNKYYISATSIAPSTYASCAINNNQSIWVETRGHDFTVQPCFAYWETKGYIDVSNVQTTLNNLYLYYYIGDTLQNANLINIGRMQEQLAEKVNAQQAARSAMPSNRYIDLTYVNGQTYTAPANGYFFMTGVSYASYGNIFFDKNSLRAQTSAYSAQAGMNLIFPIAKGDNIVCSSYQVNTIFFRFIYAEGSCE